MHIFAGRYATKNRNRTGKLKAEFYYAAFLIGIAKVRHIKMKKDRKEKLSETDAVLAKLPAGVESPNKKTSLHH